MLTQRLSSSKTRIKTHNSDDLAANGAILRD